MPDFGRVFLMLNYTEKPQNTYIQSSMFREILAREKCGLLCVLCTLSMASYSSVSAWPQRDGPSYIAMLSLDAVQWPWCRVYVLVYSDWKSVDNYDTSVSVFVVQFNGFCHSQVSLMLHTAINITETTYSCQFQYVFGNQ